MMEYKHFKFRLTATQTLCVMAIISYIIGDSLTAANMMSVKGIGHEANHIVRYFFISYGIIGIIGMKIAYFLLFSIIAFTTSKLLKNNEIPAHAYFFLFLLGGIATIANIQVVGA